MAPSFSESTTMASLEDYSYNYKNTPFARSKRISERKLENQRKKALETRSRLRKKRKNKRK